MARPTLVRPLKQGGVRTYAEAVAIIGRDKTPILAGEVDSDFRTLFDAWNDPATSFVPEGPAGGDFVGSDFPDLVIAPGRVTRDKVAPELWLPPIPTAPDDVGKFLVVRPGPVLEWMATALLPSPSLPDDLGATLVVDPGPIIRWRQVTLPPAATTANIGQVLGVEAGLSGDPELVWTTPAGGVEPPAVVESTLTTNAELTTAAVNANGGLLGELNLNGYAGRYALVIATVYFQAYQAPATAINVTAWGFLRRGGTAGGSDGTIIREVPQGNGWMVAFMASGGPNRINGLLSFDAMIGPLAATERLSVTGRIDALPGTNGMVFVKSGGIHAYVYPA